MKVVGEIMEKEVNVKEREGGVGLYKEGCKMKKWKRI